MSYDIYSALPNTANTALNIESRIFGVAEYGKYRIEYRKQNFRQSRNRKITLDLSVTETRTNSLVGDDVLDVPNPSNTARDKPKTCGFGLDISLNVLRHSFGYAEYGKYPLGI